MKLQPLVPATHTAIRSAGCTPAAGEGARLFRGDSVVFERRERARRREDRGTDAGSARGSAQVGGARRSNGTRGRRAGDLRPETGLHLRVGATPERVCHSCAFVAQVIGQQEAARTLGFAAFELAEGVAAYDIAWARRESLFHRIDPVEAYA